MNQITGTIQNIFSDRPLQEDEYRNESDNLIHCAKCKTPRQHHVVVLGKEMVVPIRCRCQQEVQDKEEAERKHREFLDQVSRLKANGLQDKSLREYTFANDKGYNPEMQKAHDYVVHWSEMKAKSIGLLLWGDVGTGKSFFCRMYRQRSAGAGCSGADDQFLPDSQRPVRAVFRGEEPIYRQPEPVQSADY